VLKKHCLLRALLYQTLANNKLSQQKDVYLKQKILILFVKITLTDLITLKIAASCKDMVINKLKTRGE